MDGRPEGEHHLATRRGRVRPQPLWSPAGGSLAVGDSAQGEGPKRFRLAEAVAWRLRSLDLPADAALVAWVSPR